MKLDDVQINHRWTDDNARQLYEKLGEQVCEMTRRRAVDLGVSMDDGDEQTAFELLKQNRKLRMSAEHRAEVWRSWDEVIDPIVKKMADLRGTFTVPEIIIKDTTHDPLPHRPL